MEYYNNEYENQKVQIDWKPNMVTQLKLWVFSTSVPTLYTWMPGHKCSKKARKELFILTLCKNTEILKAVNRGHKIDRSRYRSTATRNLHVFAVRNMEFFAHVTISDTHFLWSLYDRLHHVTWSILSLSFYMEWSIWNANSLCMWQFNTNSALERYKEVLNDICNSVFHA